MMSHITYSCTVSISRAIGVTADWKYHSSACAEPEATSVSAAATTGKSFVPLMRLVPASVLPRAPRPSFFFCTDAPRVNHEGNAEHQSFESRKGQHRPRPHQRESDADCKDHQREPDKHSQQPKR